ncbi:hypothetical protein D3C80_2025020 [compost metagenome]
MSGPVRPTNIRMMTRTLPMVVSSGVRPMVMPEVPKADTDSKSTVRNSALSVTERSIVAPTISIRDSKVIVMAL